MIVAKKIITGLLLYFCFLGCAQPEKKISIINTNESKKTSTHQKKKELPPPVKTVKKNKTDDDVDFLIKNGVIEKINPEMNEAFVSMIYWESMKIDVRQGIAKTLAAYCGRIKGGAEWVELKNPYTGNVLAKWGAFGYKSYE